MDTAAVEAKMLMNGRITSLGLAAVALASFGAPAHAQDGRAPRVRVSAAMGSVGSSYVEPTISLSEDAYVFAISVDVDRNVRILHPEHPGIAVKMNATRDLQLPRFFTSYGERDREMNARNGGYVASYYGGRDPGYSDTRGTVIAIASRRPFDFDAVTADGDWDLDAVSRLVSGREPQSAAAALAQRLGARGEAIGRGLYRFAGESRTLTSLYNIGYYGCNPYSGVPGYGPGLTYFHVAQLRRAGYRIRFDGVDACGSPRYSVHSRGLTSNPRPRPPATGVFPRRPTTPTTTPRKPGARPRAGEPATPRVRPTRPLTESERASPTVFASPKGVTGREQAERGSRPAARGEFPERGRAMPPERRPPEVERARRPEPRAERPVPRPAASGAFPRESRARPVN